MYVVIVVAVSVAVVGAGVVAGVVEHVGVIMKARKDTSDTQSTEMLHACHLSCCSIHSHNHFIPKTVQDPFVQLEGVKCHWKVT